MRKNDINNMQLFAKTNIVIVLNLPYLELFVTTFFVWEWNGTIAEVKIMFATDYIMPLSNKNVGKHEYLLQTKVIVGITVLF